MNLEIIPCLFKNTENHGLLASAPTCKELGSHCSCPNKKKKLDELGLLRIKVAGQITTSKFGETGESRELQLKSVFLKERMLEP